LHSRSPRIRIPGRSTWPSKSAALAIRSDRRHARDESRRSAPPPGLYRGWRNLRVQCRLTPSRSTTRRIEEAASRRLVEISVRRIEEAVSRRLVEKFSRDETSPSRTVESDSSTDVESDPVAALSVADDGRTLEFIVDGETHVLDRADAATLRDSLDEALTRTREFVHTASRHRDDGAYVVERRGADSAGHRKVFESFDACRRLYDRLPEEFVADDVTRTGVTGGRRHMLVWHFAEHPAFDCELVSRQPLTVAKADEETSDQPPVEVAPAD